MELAPDDPGMIESTRAMMVRQLDHMVRLVDDLMDLSRISRGKIQLTRKPVELSSIVATALETSKPLFERHSHELRVDLGPESLVVNGDADRLTQVVSNLLNNAAKYTPAQGIVELTVRRSAGEAVISVKDNGIGISASDMTHVFDMFAQVDPTQKTQSGGGLGIGLNIVKRLIELHGGQVEGTSEGSGKGSEFVVRLPLLASVEGSVPGPTNNAQHPNVPARRVLVVDDNQDAALTMAMVIQRRGHVVEVAHDGLDAVERLATFRPDIVLMDIGMPRLNGYDACVRMRQMPEGQGIAIVALSGWGQEEDRRRSEEAGFDQHVVKPVDRSTLERVIAEAKPKA
jgi:CheY-like chemotaxis protein